MALMIELWLSSSEITAVVESISGTKVPINRRVGGGEDHPLRPAVERSQCALQFHVRRVGSRYETAPRRARFPSPGRLPPQPESPQGCNASPR